MPMKKRYYSVNGQIIGEQTTGQPRVDYLTDALGSVTATVDQNSQIVNTYCHKPYGDLVAKTGVGADPAFGWVGTQGYRPAATAYSDVYVRARHYSSNLGSWTTYDPAGTMGAGSLYSYVYGAPTNHYDSSGLVAPVVIGGGVVGTEALEAAAAAFGLSETACLSSPPCRDAAVQNAQAGINASIEAAKAAAQAIADLYEKCKKTRCNLKDEGPHHFFTMPRLGIPPIKKCWMRHI